MWRPTLVCKITFFLALVSSRCNTNFQCTYHFYSCWLSVEKGTIFGFVAPMLAIILVSKINCVAIMDSTESVQINALFMVLALQTLASVRKRQFEKKKDSKFKARQELGRLVGIYSILPISKFMIVLIVFIATRSDSIII